MLKLPTSVSVAYRIVFDIIVKQTRNQFPFYLLVVRASCSSGANKDQPLIYRFHFISMVPHFNIYLSLYIKIYLICLKSIYKMTKKKTEKSQFIFVSWKNEKGKKSNGKTCRRVFGIHGGMAVKDIVNFSFLFFSIMVTHSYRLLFLIAKLMNLRHRTRDYQKLKCVSTNFVSTA